MKTNHNGRIFIAFLSLLLTTQSAHAVQYHFADLGTLSGDNYSYANAINDSGQVVGMSNPIFVASMEHAVLYNGSAKINLGILSGYINCTASGINNSGQIVGISSSGSNARAFLYNGSLNDLGIPSGFTSSFVYNINNNGQIAGGASYVQPVTLKSISHAFLNNGSTWTDLGVPAGYLSSGGGAINSNGLIAGSATTSGSISHAFLSNGSTWTDLGTLYPSNPSSCSGAADINDNGLIVGNSSTSNAFPYSDSHAFLYNGSGMIDLGVASGADMSVGHAINNNGQIVGDLRLNGTGDHPYHAFIYEDSTMKDLNTLLDSSAAGWTITTATDINNNGQIVGWATNSSGYTHAVLLTPVPEPSIIALFITGAIALLAHWRLRRE